MHMAHLLERRGETVERVAIIDGPPPRRRHVDDAQLLGWFLNDLDLGITRGMLTPADLRLMVTAPLHEALADALEFVAYRGLHGVDAASLQPAWDVFRRVVRACHDHDAPPVAADLLVVKAAAATVEEFLDHPAAESPDWGWAAHTTGRVDTVIVPGTHHTLLREPLVDHVAEAMSAPAPLVTARTG
jgi:thioesterase domain-containing protein